MVEGKIIVGAEAPVKLRISRRKSPRLREELVQGVLRCGLRACVLPKPDFCRKIAIVSARYGSTDLRFRTAQGTDHLDTPPGIAHFLEHQLFKKEGEIDLLMEFGQYGANSNAFTDGPT